MSGDERCARAACAPYNLISGMVFATWLLLTPKSSSAADGIEEVAKIQMVVGVKGSFPPPLTGTAKEPNQPIFSFKLNVGIIDKASPAN